MTDPQHAVYRHHHMTLCVGDAQEDYDFHTKVLDLKIGEEDRPLRRHRADLPPVLRQRHGRRSRRSSPASRCASRAGWGGGGPARSARSACRCRPRRSASGTRGSPTTASRPRRRSGSARRCSSSRTRAVSTTSWSASPTTVACRTPAARSPARTASAARTASPCRCTTSKARWSSWRAAGTARKTAEEGDFIRYEVGDGGTGTIIDFVREPDLDIGSWTFGEGTVHHCAFQVDIARHPDRGEGAPRGPRLHRCVRSQGSRLLRLRVRAHAGRRVVRGNRVKSEGFLIDETVRDARPRVPGSAGLRRPEGVDHGVPGQARVRPLIGRDRDVDKIVDNPLTARRAGRYCALSTHGSLVHTSHTGLNRGNGWLWGRQRDREGCASRRLLDRRVSARRLGAPNKDGTMSNADELKFYYFHHHHYSAPLPDDAADVESTWVTYPNSRFDPETAHDLYRRHRRTLQLAESLGFDGITINEHHNTIYSMTPVVSVMAGSVVAFTERDQDPGGGRAGQPRAARIASPRHTRCSTTCRAGAWSTPFRSARAWSTGRTRTASTRPTRANGSRSRWRSS